MEAWQIEYINTNLPELADLTDFGQPIQEYLLLNDVLSPEDLETLGDTRRVRGQIDQASKLYDMLRGRVKSYEILTRALFTNHQSGAAKILLEGLTGQGIQTPLAYCGISVPDNGFDVAEIMISGKCHRMVDYFCDVEPVAIRDVFKQTLTDVDYFELITNKTPFVLVKQRIPLEPSVYVPRYLSNSSKIKTNSSKLKVPIGCVHNGLKKCIICAIGHYGFEDDFVDYYITENEFMTLQLATNERSFSVCICDAPGMGKTLLLANIARRLAAENKKHVTAFIQLNMFLKSIKIRPLPNIEKNEQHAIIHLFNYISASSKVASVLQNLLSNGICWLNVLFDGFEGISLEEGDWIKQLVKALVDKFVKVRVYITSRPHMKKELEETLGVTAYDILPFTEKDKVDFLVKFWLNKKPNIVSERIRDCAYKCLQAAKYKITTRNFNITCTPFSCLSIAEIYADQAFSFCITTRENFRFTPYQTSNMYKSFITKRIREFTSNEEEYCILFGMHVDYAFANLFPEYDWNHEPISESSKQQLLKIGILQQSANAELEFVHKTIAEYLVGGSFAYRLTSIFGGLFFTSEKALEFLVDEILSSFGFFKHSGIVYFLDSTLFDDLTTRFVAPGSVKYFATLKPEKLYNILYDSTFNAVNFFRYWKKVIATVADNKRVRKYFTKVRLFELVKNIIYKSKSSELLVDCHHLIEQVFDFKFSQLSKGFPDRLSWIRTATQLGDYDAFEYLFDKCRFNRDKDQLVNVCVSRTSEIRLSDAIQNRINILKLLLSKYPNIIQETPNLLVCDEIHYKLKKVLLELGADMNACREDKNFLSFEVESPHHQNSDFHELVQYLILDRKAEYLFRESATWKDPLPIIFENADILPQTLALILGIPDMDFNKITNGENLLFPILRCRSSCSFDKVRKLVEKGVDPNKLGQNNQSLLHLVTERNMGEILEYLLSKGLNPNCSDDNGNSPLHAVRSFFTGKLLVDHGANFKAINNIGQSVLHTAAKMKDKDWAMFLLSKGLNVNHRAHDGSTILHVCQNLKVFKRCVELGADIFVTNNEGQNVLHTIITSWLEMDGYRYIVSKGLNVNDRDKEGNSPLLYCMIIERITCLVELGADVQVKNNYGQTLMHKMAESLDCGSTDIFEYLISLGLNINNRDNDGNTPVHLCKQFKPFQRYVELGADMFLTNNQGENVLHRFINVWRGTDGIRYVVSKGLKIDDCDKDGNTALLNCTDYDKITCLIELGADVHVKNNNGQSLMHKIACASDCSKISIVQNLLSLGLNINHRDNDGLTPLCYLKQTVEINKFIKLGAHK